MYYPYLRGKQNELLALQELLDDKRLNSRVVPIIEPVRFNRTYVNTLLKFNDEHREIVIIQNPGVGSFEKEILTVRQTAESAEDEKKQKIAKALLDDYNNVIKSDIIRHAYICDKKWSTDFQEGNDWNGKSVEDLVLIATTDELYDLFEENDKTFEQAIKVIGKKSDIGDLFAHNLVVLDDGFNKQKKNADYGDKEEIFSRAHLNYTAKGFKGFSDYSIVGEVYEEEGFAPSNISIHIVFFDAKSVLAIHHFTSEKSGQKDQAGKFAAAMEKAKKWVESESIEQTLGLRKLLEKYDNEYYPGLGTIKRYTIMHHLELIGDYLERLG